MNETLKPCPSGHIVDADECPYPVNRERTIWQVACHCGWAAVGDSPGSAVSIWNTRPPAQEAVEESKDE